MGTRNSNEERRVCGSEDRDYRRGESKRGKLPGPETVREEDRKQPEGRRGARKRKTAVCNVKKRSSINKN